MAGLYSPPARVAIEEENKCRNNCGRMRFQKFETCCTHCKGVDGPHASDCAEKQNQMQAECSGQLALSDKWYWGHMDSQVDPPQKEPPLLDAITAPLKLLPNHKYFRDFVRFAKWPSFLDAKAQGRATQGCPFLGGTAYLRHADVKSQLENVADNHVHGLISRQNELGYFVLGAEAFPMNKTLSLGCPVEQHRIQRKWIEYLLHPTRLPNRDAWVEAVENLMRTQTKLKLKGDIAKWWQQMLWLHVCQIDLTWEAASQFTTFQEQWLVSAVVEFPNQVATYLPEWASIKKVWSLQKVQEEQQRYRRDIESSLPSEVPSEDKSLVAQAVLEMFVFAGGLSVPQTIQAAIAVLFSPDLLPSPVSISAENIEAFVYEVTRLFPAVQGFCYWRDGQRQILSLNAAMRDPAVWGRYAANRFSLKDVTLYRSHHVGFANQATSTSGEFDSKSCPGYMLALDVVQAFVLVLASWSPSPRGSERVRSRPLRYWTTVTAPKPCPVPNWWSSFEIECLDWLDGDQAGEDLVPGSSNYMLEMA